ncbi:MAG: hypothetical protein ABJE95_37215 [Byssovorax sp.]
MRTWTDSALCAVLLACSLLGGASCNSAFADEKKPYPKPYGSGAPSAGASASAKPPEPEAKPVDGHKPWAPTLDVVLPDVVSDPPTKEEWVKAPPAWDMRITDPGCKAQRIREWYRVSCGFGEVEMIGGATAGVSFICHKANVDEGLCDDGVVIFPARRGDSRAFQFLRWGKWGPEPDALLTEQYLEGDAYPSLSLQGVRWEF